MKSGRTSAPTAEDYDDIARRLKEIEGEKAKTPERPAAADEPVKMNWLDYYVG